MSRPTQKPMRNRVIVAATQLNLLNKANTLG